MSARAVEFITIQLFALRFTDFYVADPSLSSSTSCRSIGFGSTSYLLFKFKSLYCSLSLCPFSLSSRIYSALPLPLSPCSMLHPHSRVPSFSWTHNQLVFKCVTFPNHMRRTTTIAALGGLPSHFRGCFHPRPSTTTSSRELLDFPPLLHPIPPQLSSEPLRPVFCSGT